MHIIFKLFIWYESFWTINWTGNVIVLLICELLFIAENILGKKAK
jgi:hypothetical protein